MNTEIYKDTSNTTANGNLAIDLLNRDAYLLSTDFSWLFFF